MAVDGGVTAVARVGCEGFDYLWNCSFCVAVSISSMSVNIIISSISVIHGSGYLKVTAVLIHVSLHVIIVVVVLIVLLTYQKLINGCGRCWWHRRPGP